MFFKINCQENEETSHRMRENIQNTYFLGVLYMYTYFIPR